MKIFKKRWFFPVSFIVLVLLIVFLFASSKNIVIMENNNTYYKAKLYTIVRQSVIVSASKKKYKSYKKAFKNKCDNCSLNILNLNTVKRIYFLHDNEEAEEVGTVPSKYLGKYKIKATGHGGILRLWARGNRVYGTVQFPNWAKGKREYLKKVRIYKNKIQFTRSATSVKELRRIGAGSYFIQNFKGTYYKDGKKIKGKFSNKGGKSSWEAKK